MISIFKRAPVKPEETLPPVEYRTEPVSEEKSFGKEFNLIRAVDEEGNKRIKQIDKRLIELRKEINDLEHERLILCELTDVVFQLQPKKDNS